MRKFQGSESHLSKKNLASPRTNLKPNKLLGQNWLINPRIIADVLRAAEIKGGETIIEVGPGTGLLTLPLARQGAKIIAIEKDPRLIPKLQEELKSWQHVKIVETDILKFNPSDYDLRANSYKVIGNLPYYLTSHFLRTVLEKWPLPELIVLMIQKEVAQRIVAKAPHLNLLALSVQYFAQPEIIKKVAKGNFNPRPKVDSAIIRLRPYPTQSDPAETKKLFKIIKAGFSSKRKKLINNLASQLNLTKEILEQAFKKLGLDLNIRAENLDLKQWQALNSLLSLSS